MRLSRGIELMLGRCPFTPRVLPSLMLWHETDPDLGAVVYDANGISQLTDLSGNAGHLTQSDNAKKPARVVAGASAIARCDGTDYMQTGAIAQAQPYSVVVAAKWTRSASYSALQDSSGGSSNRHVTYSTSSSANLIQMVAGVSQDFAVTSWASFS